MVALALLQHPAAKRWLDGIVPAWTLLDGESFDALYRPPRSAEGALRLADDVTPDESPVARNALLVLQKASSGPGLKLTQTGNLSRSVVAEMIDLLCWPSFDKERMLAICKVVNEPDYLPLFFLHDLLRSAGLVRRHRGFLKASKAGRAVLEEPARRGLQGLLFHVAFWQLDLRIPGGLSLSGWPQNHMGVLLWSLSVAAGDWQSAMRLARLCTPPTVDVLESPWDRGSIELEYGIIRPLIWFGVMEQDWLNPAKRRPGDAKCYRKTALFDRFLSFDVKLERTGERRH